MEADLGLGLSGQQWVYLSYALSLSAFYLVTGAIGDRVGLRRTFVVGVILFAIASLATALAPDERVLLIGRALQGVGGAALTTTSLALLRVTWAGPGGAGDRPVDVADQPRHDRRPAARWRHRPGGVVALGLPRQRAARGRDGGAVDRRPGAQRAPRDAIDTGPDRLGARRGRPGRSHLCARRGARERPRRRAHPACRGRCRPGSARDLDTQSRRSGRAAAAAPRSRARAGEHRHPGRVCGPGRAPFVSAGLPPVSRLLAHDRGARVRTTRAGSRAARPSVRRLRRSQLDRGARSPRARWRSAVPCSCSSRSRPSTTPGSGCRSASPSSRSACPPLWRRSPLPPSPRHPRSSPASRPGSTRRPPASEASCRWPRSAHSQARCSSLPVGQPTRRSTPEPRGRSAMPG